MKNAEILQCVATYMVSNSNKLKKIMPKENYFLIYGRRSTSERTYANSEIYHGHAIDILAELIEKDKFFGWWISEEVDQADRSDNLKIKVIKEGEEITWTYTAKFTEGGLKLWIPGLEVKQKQYMNPIRTREGFVGVTSILGLEGDLEKISRELFTD